MATKYGRCNNYGECSLADNHEDIEASSDNFVCSECGKPLKEIAWKNATTSNSNNILKFLLPLALIFIILIGVLAWVYLKSNPTPPAVLHNKNITKQDTKVLKKSQDNIILRLHGSNTIGAKLAPSLAIAFMKEKGYKDIQKVFLDNLEVLIKGKKDNSSTFDAIEIKAHGTKTAFDETNKNQKVGLLGGYADIGIASSHVKDDIKSKFISNNLGDPTSRTQEHIIALDGVAVIINPNNPIKQLSIDKIKKIFLGEITDWSEVGGNAGTIKLYSLDEQSGTYDIFKSKILVDRQLKCDNSQNIVCFEDNKELVSNIMSDSNGIGYVGLNYTDMVKKVKISIREDVNAIAPSRFTIKTEDYPLGRRLFFYQTNNAKPLASEFIQFTLSDAGQKIVSDMGLIEVSVLIQKDDNSNIDTDKQRILSDPFIPNKYKELIRNADRKDTQLNFRFKSGTSELDNKAFRDIGRLAEKLSKNEFKNAKLILIGFSDPKGDAAQNLKLSIDRANKVKNELLSEGVLVDVVTGFGETPSLLLDPREDNEDSLSRNRRVEVWLKH